MIAAHEIPTPTHLPGERVDYIRYGFGIPYEGQDLSSLASVQPEVNLDGTESILEVRGTEVSVVVNVGDREIWISVGFSPKEILGGDFDAWGTPGARAAALALVQEKIDGLFIANCGPRHLNMVGLELESVHLSRLIPRVQFPLAHVVGLRYAPPIPGVSRELDYSSPSPVLRVALVDGSTASLCHLADHQPGVPEGTLCFEARISAVALQAWGIMHPTDLTVDGQWAVEEEYWKKAGFHADVVHLGALEAALETIDDYYETWDWSVDELRRLVADYHRGSVCQDQDFEPLRESRLAVAPLGIREVPEGYFRQIDAMIADDICRWTYPRDCF